MKYIILVLLVLCGSAQAQWTTEQKWLAAASMTALAIDYGQTRSIVVNISDGGGRFERNPMISRFPTMGQVNQHFLLTPVIAYLVLDNISSENRTMALSVLTTVQVGIVAHNYLIGINARF
jgi:hypothetical protein